jgi:hypothetical protein
VEEQVALGDIEEGATPVWRVALSTPKQGKDASIDHTVNVGQSSNYDSHISYIFVAVLSTCPTLILVVHADIPKLSPASGRFEGTGTCTILWRNVDPAAWP